MTFEYVPINVKKSLDEYISGNPREYTIDIQDYIQKYDYLGNCNTEVLCLSVLKYNLCTIKLTNVPLAPTKISDVIHYDMLGHLVNVDCAIRKVSEVKLEMTSVFLRCTKCGQDYGLVEPDPLNILHPLGIECAFCGFKGNFTVDPERSIYVDSQHVTAQELQINTEHGKQPKTIPCILRGSLVDRIVAGEHVRLTGIVKLRYDKDTFSTIYLDVVGVTSLRETDSDIKLTEQDINNIKELASRDNVYDILSESICPLVYGYRQVKKSIVFQIFGGVTIDLGDSQHIRGNSHILLCGDPGLAKSKLLSSVANLVPNSVYTSGKSSSAAGLTAAAVRDEIDGKWVLEAGALPLADGGIAVVDELDKMSNEDRSALHEAMEQQTITVNKAGISAQLLTRCSLLAAANPSLGKFDRDIPLSNQVDLPPSLLSRFDLIYMMTDDPNDSTDMFVAKHILESRRNAECIARGEVAKSSVGVCKPIDTLMFRKYLVYARTIIPVISDEVIDMLAEKYVSLRGSQGEFRVTPRQLEALIRLSESSARIRLSPVVTEEDAERALSLYVTAMGNITLSNEKSDDGIWCRGNNIILSLIPPDGMILQDLVDRVLSRTLMTEEDINNELLSLVSKGKVSLNKIGTSTYVVKS